MSFAYSSPAGGMLFGVSGLLLLLLYTLTSKEPEAVFGGFAVMLSEELRGPGVPQQGLLGLQEAGARAGWGKEQEGWSGRAVAACKMWLHAKCVCMQNVSACKMRLHAKCVCVHNVAACKMRLHARCGCMQDASACKMHLHARCGCIRQFSTAPINQLNKHLTG